MATPKRNKLQPTSWLMLVGVCLIMAITAFFVTDTWLSYGYPPIFVSVLTGIIPLVLAIGILWQGWKVRSYRMGKRAMNVLSAARIWLLSQAISRLGALIAGIFLGMSMSYVRYIYSDVMVDQLVITLSLAAASVVMAVAGLVAELWCKNDDEDDDEAPPAIPA